MAEPLPEIAVCIAAINWLESNGKPKETEVLIDAIREYVAYEKRQGRMV